MKVTNYIEEFQQGGSIKQQLAQLVEAAMAGDQNASQQIDEIILAALKGNKKAQEYAMVIQQIMQAKQLQTAFAKVGTKIENDKNDEVKYLKGLKCGGKTKKTTKKTKTGKCGCMLKRLGGRIVEVDSCTGLPIKK